MKKIFTLGITAAKAEAPHDTRRITAAMPATAYEVMDIYDRLALQEDEKACMELAECSPQFDFLHDVLDTKQPLTSSGLQGLNILAHRLSQMNPIECGALEGLIQMDMAEQKTPATIPRLLVLAQSTEQCHVVTKARTDAQLGRFLLENSIDFEPDDLQPVIRDALDPARVGAKHRIACGGVFTSVGYVERHSDLIEENIVIEDTPPVPDYCILLETEAGGQLRLPAETLPPEGSFQCKDCCIPALTDAIDRADSLASVNTLAQALRALPPKRLRACKAAFEASQRMDLKDALPIVQNAEHLILSDYLHTPAALAEENLSFMISSPFHEELLPFVDLHSYGSAMMERLHCRVTDYGMVERDDGEPLTAPFEQGRSIAAEKALADAPDPQQQKKEGVQMQNGKNWVKFLREQYPPGTRVKMCRMDSDPNPILPGSTGHVIAVDDAGNIHMQWDDGRTLSLIPGEDQFTVLPPETTMLKLYMPLTAELYKEHVWRHDEGEEPETLCGCDLTGYMNVINGALLQERAPEESERGWMRWYFQEDSLAHKVRRAQLLTEARGGQLWSVAECHITEPLTDDEMEKFKRFVWDQIAGAEENFAQWPITLENGMELYVHLYPEKEFFIKTEDELFGPFMEQEKAEYMFPGQSM